MRKYSEKYINSYKILKCARIGMEFEFYSNLSYYKTLEIMNIEFAPVKIHGFRQYHSSFTPDKENFKLEPDLSGGSNMAELITGPLDYFTARHYLLKILKFVQTHGYTNDKCSLHINISFDKELCNKDVKNLNVLKHILRTNEDEIYSIFPSRQNNIYAKSIKKLIPFKDYDFSNVGVDVIKQSLRIPNDKYYGINMSNINNYDSARLEYRYIGGKNYEKKSGDIIELMDKFIIQTYEDIDGTFDNDDINELGKYLDSKISNFKSFNKYDNFLVEFPTIDIQIDQDGQYDIVNSYYPRIYSKLFDLIESVEDISNCVINYYTTEQKVEIVGAEFKSVMNIKGYDFINCDIYSGIFNECNFVGCTVLNAHINKSTVTKSDIKKTKIISSSVEGCSLDNCFFMGGYLNSNMEGGIFRSGKIGPYGTLSSTTKVVNDNSNFFQVKYEEDEKDDKPKSLKSK